MTNHDCTTSSAVSESKAYPTLITNSDYHHIAEETDDYHPHSQNPDPFPSTLKRHELRALQMAGFGQVGRLYKLAKMLLDADASEWTAEQLKNYALEIRKTGNQLEDLLTDIVGPLVNDPKLKHDESNRE